MDELRRSMLNELARIGGSFKSEYEIASAREQSLQASLEKVTVNLRVRNSLKSSCESYRAMLRCIVICTIPSYNVTWRLFSSNQFRSLKLV